MAELDKEVTALDYMIFVHDNGVGFRSIEKPCTLASRSEIRRWLNNHAVNINGERPGSKDIVTLPVSTLVLFPNGQQKTTLLFEGYNA